MARLTAIEVPSYAEHLVTGFYGVCIIQHRNVEWRIMFGKGFTKVTRDGIGVDAITAVPAPVKVKAMDGYLNYLKFAAENERNRESA